MTFILGLVNARMGYGQIINGIRMKIALRYTMSLLVVLIGMTVMVGWMTHTSGLIQISPQFAPMQFNTAILFVLSGLGVLFLDRWQKVSAGLGAIIFLLSAITLLQYPMHIDLGIDQLFLHHYITTNVSHPGRMAPSTGLCFILWGLMLFCDALFRDKASVNRLVVFAVITIGGIGVYTFFGYVFDFSIAYKWGSMTDMALHTSLNFILLAIACAPIAKDRFQQSFGLDSYFLCMIAAVIGFSLSLFFCQRLLVYENHRTIMTMGHDADFIIGQLQFHASDASIRRNQQLFVERHLGRDFLERYVIKITHKNTSFFQNEPAQPASHYESWIVTKKAVIDNVEWVVSIWPTEHFIRSESTGLPILFLITGLVITVLMVILLRFWQINHRKAKNMRLIDQATLIASDAQDTTIAMSRCLRLICDTIGWPIGHVYLVKRRETPVLESSRIWYLRYPEKSEKFRRVTEKTTFTKGIGLPGRIWETAKSAWIVNVMKDNNFPRAKEEHDIGVRSAIGFPIACDKAIVAVFEFFSFDVKYFDDELLRTFEIMSEQIGHVFERKDVEKKLSFIAYHDSLTGIGNRVQFERVGEEAMSRAVRHGKKMAIFLLDLDGFKQVNDTFGHGVGDCLLQEVVHRFQSVVRATDALARIGGDEFVAITEDFLEPKTVEIIAKKILSAVDQPFYIKEHVLNITISIGIALYPDDGDTLSSLMRNADMALYRAKETGKNKFCICFGSKI